VIGCGVQSEIQPEVDALAVLTDDQIKTDDIPEVQDWSNAKRGALYRPIKKQIVLRLSTQNSPIHTVG